MIFNQWNGTPTDHVFPCEKWAIHNLSFEAPIYIFTILKEEDGTLRE